MIYKNTWTDINGKEWQLKDMSDKHLLNSFAMLKSNAGRLHYQYIVSNPFGVNIEFLDHEYTEEAAIEWLENTDLYKAFKQEINNRKLKEI